MGELLTIIEEFLDRRGWPHEQLPGHDVVSFPFQGETERWIVYGEAREDDRRVIFYSVIPFNVPAQRRPAMADFLTRANYGLHIGNFELDLEDGEVRFKTSLDVKGAHLTADLVERAVVMNLHATNRYLPGIAALVSDSGQSPAELLARLEA